MLRWLWLTVVVIALDQITKYWASTMLDFQQPLAVMPLFNLTLMHNYGAAFSFLASAGGWQRWFFTVIAVAISIAIIVWLYRLKAHQRWEAAAMSLILGGALGNLWDRLTLGYVVDFFDVYYGPHHFPAFNIADSAITLGAALLIIDLLFLQQRSES